MERLTEKRGACYHIKGLDTENLQKVANQSLICTATDKLAAYEDAEEQGRLVELPPIKDATIYIIEETIEPPIERWVTNRPVNFYDITGLYCGFGLAQVRYDFADIGKTVFLTREDAEAALAAQKGGKPE